MCMWTGSKGCLLRLVSLMSVKLVSCSNRQPSCRWTGKKASSINGHKIDFVTVGSRTSAFVPALQKVVGGSAAGGSSGEGRWVLVRHVVVVALQCEDTAQPALACRAGLWDVAFPPRTASSLQRAFWLWGGGQGGGAGLWRERGTVSIGLGAACAAQRRAVPCPPACAQLCVDNPACCVHGGQRRKTKAAAGKKAGAAKKGAKRRGKKGSDDDDEDEDDKEEEEVIIVSSKSCGVRCVAGSGVCCGGVSLRGCCSLHGLPAPWVIQVAGLLVAFCYHLRPGSSTLALNG